MTSLTTAATIEDRPISPVGSAFRVFQQEGMHEVYARARETEPVFWAPEIGYWVVTRYDDVVSIFRDTVRFSAANALDPITPLPDDVVAGLRKAGFTVQPVQVNSDPPVHGRIRAIAGQFLNAKRFASYEGAIRSIVSDYVDRLDRPGDVDLVTAMTYELPARVIFLLMGIPEVDTANIKRWADNRLVLTWGKLDAVEQRAAAGEMLDYWNYCKALVDARIERPSHDYPSHLLALRDGDDSILTLNEVTCLVFGILLAGHETTTNASSNIVSALLGAGDAWARLVYDPSLIPAAVEEGLRIASSVVNWRRVTREPVEVAGVGIPKGAKILLALASANRDESLFRNPDDFDIERDNARRHLSFGHGAHMCIGAPLARLQLRIILEELTRRFPRMTLVEDQKIDWIRTISFRGPEHLFVRPHGGV